MQLLNREVPYQLGHTAMMYFLDSHLLNRSQDVIPASMVLLTVEQLGPDRFELSPFRLKGGRAAVTPQPRMSCGARFNRGQIANMRSPAR
jgi:hypothetical protein